MYRPNDIFYRQFTTTNISGVSTNTDTTPLGILVKNGVDDFTPKVFVTNVDLGRYSISGIVPNTYIKGNSISLTVSGYVAGSLTKANIDLGQIDSLYVGDLIGIAGLITSITGSAPTNFIGSNSISPGLTVSITGTAPSLFLVPGSVANAVTVSATGNVQANIISANPGITISVTGTVGIVNLVNTVTSIINPVSTSGTTQANVISFSGVPVASANVSGAILSDLRYIQGSLATTYNGIARSGAPGWIQLSASDSTTDQFYRFQHIALVGGQGQGQVAIITSYSGATQQAYIQTPHLNGNWLVNPYNDTQYSLGGNANVAVQFLLRQLMTSGAGVNFNTFFDDGGTQTSKIVDNVGSATASSVSVTGVAPANFLGLGSISPGVTVSVTGTINANVVSVSGVPSYPVGTQNVNVISFSGVNINSVPNVFATNTVAVTGNVGINWGNIINQNAFVNFTNTSLSGINTPVPVNVSGITVSATGIINANVVSISGVPVYPIGVQNVNVVSFSGTLINTVPNVFAVNTVSVTGVINANVVSVSGIPAVPQSQLTASITGTLNVTSISPGVIINANVISFSGVPVAGANVSGAILADLRYIQGNPTTLYDGTAQGGTSNTITLAASESSIDNFHQNKYISLVGGTGVGQFALIGSYVGFTKVATIAQPTQWYTIPNTTTQYSFTGFGTVNLNLNQAIPPTGNIIESVGDALIGARTQAFGNFTLTQVASTGLILTMQSANGLIVKSFQMPADYVSNLIPTRRF